MKTILIIIIILFFIPTFCSTVVGEQSVAKATWHENVGGNGHTYEAIYVPGGIKWEQAYNAATSKGGHLATIEDEAENEFVYRLIAFHGCADSSNDMKPIWHIDQGLNFIGPWLGGYKNHDNSDPESGWRWVNQEPWIYTNWGYKEPNNSNGIEDRLIYASKQFKSYCPPGYRCINDPCHYTSGSSWKGFPCEVRTNGYIVEYE